MIKITMGDLATIINNLVTEDERFEDCFDIDELSDVLAENENEPIISIKIDKRKNTFKLEMKGKDI